MAQQATTVPVYAVGVQLRPCPADSMRPQRRGGSRTRTARHIVPGEAAATTMLSSSEKPGLADRGTAQEGRLPTPMHA
jgi:hypothetical protein